MVAGERTRKRPDRVHAIQLLRFIAASVVALVHQAFAFADHVGEGFGLAPPSDQWSQSAVALFFIVSGYVMVISSRSLFGDLRGNRIFLTRRCVRILPPYWLATIGLVVLYLLLGTPVSGADLLRSLALIPYWSEATPGWALPMLWVGWTLFYEMVFYGLFSLGVPLGRPAAIGIASTGLVVLVAAGVVFSPQSAVLATLTRPVALIFILGMALALFRERGGALPSWLRAALVLAAIPAFVLIPAPDPAQVLGFQYLAWAGMPAACLATALLGGPLRLPAFALIDRLGDISYALYLLHVPVAVVWMWAFQKAFHPQGPWALFITMVAATYITSAIAFRLIETPMTRWLNARLLPAAKADDLLQQTGV